MSDVIGTSLSILLIGFIFIVMPLVIYHNHRRKTISNKILINGKGYTYTIGNNIEYLRHGLRIDLEFALPAIYIDTLNSKDQKHATVSTLINSAKISLEGDFSKKFQVFCVKGNEREALRVLTPDVMLLISEYANTFDIEINGNKIWIMSDKKVLKNNILNQKLLEAAQLLLVKIDRVAQNNSFDSQAVTMFEVRYYRTLKLFGLYIPKNIFYVSILCLFLSSTIWLSLLYAYVETSKLLYLPIIFSFMIFPLTPYIVNEMHKRDSGEMQIINDDRNKQKRAIALAAKNYLSSLFNNK